MGPAGSHLATELNYVESIIWDERVMFLHHCIDVVDITMGNLMQIRRSFEGKVLLFSGDYRQILPVVDSKSHMQIIHAIEKMSPLYRQFWTS